jgi:AraC-like DNA-binding protein/quercetin dioxygenase-like cupin family protein
MRNVDWKESFSVVDPQIRADGVHVWPFDPSFPVAVNYMFFAERTRFRMNRHDYFEVACVLKGEIECQVASRSFIVKSDELMVIGSRPYHRMLRKTRSRPKVATLFFMPEILCGPCADGDGPEFLLPFYLQDDSFPYIVRAETGIPREIAGLVQRIYSELPAVTNRGRLSVRTYLRMILILLVNHYGEEIAKRQLVNRKHEATGRLVPLFEFLEKHYNQDISGQDAAGLLDVPKPHFLRFFKEVTGQSFITYLNHFRIAKAQAMLGSTDMPLTQVSQEVGFCDQSYFGSVFLRFVGMTPRTYRRRFGKFSK